MYEKAANTSEWMRRRVAAVWCGHLLACGLASLRFIVG